MILVCVTDQQSCSRLIQAGRRVADRFDTTLNVISVRPRGDENWFASDELEYLYQYAKKLQAEMFVHFHDDPAEAVVDYIRKNTVRGLIVGEPPESGKSRFIAFIHQNLPELPIIEIDTKGQIRLAKSQMPGTNAFSHK